MSDLYLRAVNQHMFSVQLTFPPSHEVSLLQSQLYFIVRKVADLKHAAYNQPSGTKSMSNLKELNRQTLINHSVFTPGSDNGLKGSFKSLLNVQILSSKCLCACMSNPSLPRVAWKVILYRVSQATVFVFDIGC
eukprot:244132-Chlamydomonas_euryale.AAC.6